MTKKEIFDAFDRLGMIAENDAIPTDLISVINFVDELTNMNDLDTLRKFLIVLLYDEENKKKE